MKLYRIIYRTGSTSRRSAIIPATSADAARDYITSAADHAEILSVRTTDRDNFINALISSKPALFTAAAIADAIAASAGPDYKCIQISDHISQDAADAARAAGYMYAWYDTDKPDRIILADDAGHATSIAAAGINPWLAGYFDQAAEDGAGRPAAPPDSVRDMLQS